MDFAEHGGVYLAGYAPGASATGWPDLFTAQEWCCARTNCGGITWSTWGRHEKKCADEGGTCQCKGQVKTSQRQVEQTQGELELAALHQRRVW